MPTVNNKPPPAPSVFGREPPSMFKPDPMVVFIGVFVTLAMSLIGWVAEKWKQSKKTRTRKIT